MIRFHQIKVEFIKYLIFFVSLVIYTCFIQWIAQQSPLLAGLLGVLLIVVSKKFRLAEIKALLLLGFLMFGVSLIFFAVYYTSPLLTILIGVLLSICDFILFVLNSTYNYILPFIVIMLSIRLMLVNNPIECLLTLIAIFLFMIIFLLSIQAEFLAMIFLIIYIGAISILFLFVIMMFNLKELHLDENSFTFYTSSLAAIFLAPKLYAIVVLDLRCYIYNMYTLRAENSFEFENEYFTLFKHQDIFIFSTLLYTEYSLLFLLLGFILLTAMLGAIVLALSTVAGEQEDKTIFKV